MKAATPASARVWPRSHASLGELMPLRSWEATRSRGVSTSVWSSAVMLRF